MGSKEIYLAHLRSEESIEDVPGNNKAFLNIFYVFFAGHFFGEMI